MQTIATYSIGGHAIPGNIILMIFDGFEPVSFLENENLPLPFWKIAYLGKCSFSECYGNAEIGWMTFELLLI